MPIWVIFRNSVTNYACLKADRWAVFGMYWLCAAHQCWQDGMKMLWAGFGVIFIAKKADSSWSLMQYLMDSSTKRCCHVHLEMYYIVGINSVHKHDWLHVHYICRYWLHCILLLNISNLSCFTTFPYFNVIFICNLTLKFLIFLPQ